MTHETLVERLAWKWEERDEGMREFGTSGGDVRWFLREIADAIEHQFTIKGEPATVVALCERLRSEANGEGT